MSVGEILDTALKVYRNNFATLVKIVAVVLAPIYLLLAIIQISARPTAGTTRSIAAAVGAFIVVIVLSLLASQVATGAAFKAIGEAYLGHQPDTERSIRFAITKLGPMLLTGLLFGLAVAIGSILCIVPGIYLGVAFSLFIPVLFLEDLSGTKALSRSRELVSGRWWPILAVFVLAYIVIFIFSIILGVILGAIVSGAGNNSVVAIIVSFITNTISGALTTPFLAAVVTVTYFDQRVRKEGFDIELLTQRFGIDPPADGTGLGGPRI